MSETKFKSGDSVEILRGKKRGTYGTVFAVRELIDWFDLRSRSQVMYMAYYVKWGEGDDESQIFRAGSLRSITISEDQIVGAKEGLLKTLKELLGE